MFLLLHFTCFGKNSGRNLFLPGWFKLHMAESCQPCHQWCVL